MLDYKHPLLMAILSLAISFTISCSSDDGGNDDVSSPSGIQISSSSQQGQSSSSEQSETSSSSTGNDVSSSSGQTGIDCEALNKNMAVEMNLNGICPEQELMYHGVVATWNNIPTTQEITDAINLVDSGKLISSEVNTASPTTLNFAGAGKLTIMIPSSFPQLTSIRDADNINILGSTFINRGQMQYNGDSYTLYTHNNSATYSNTNLIISF
jgi:hypothetical protein